MLGEIINEDTYKPHFLKYNEVKPSQQMLFLGTNDDKKTIVEDNEGSEIAAGQTTYKAISHSPRDSLSSS